MLLMRLPYLILISVATTAVPSTSSAATGGTNKNSLPYIVFTLLNMALGAFISWLVAQKTARKTLENEMRAKSELQIYPRLSSSLGKLRDLNQENLRNNANPICLKFKRITIRHNPDKLCLPGGSHDKCIQMYTPILKEIREQLSKPEMTCPNRCNKDEWKKQVKVIESFISLVIDRNGLESIDNIDKCNVANEYKALERAIDSLIIATY